MKRDYLLHCEHGKLFCIPCDFENSVQDYAARRTGHEYGCRCQQCAIIRRDRRRAFRKATIETVPTGGEVTRKA